MHEDFEGYQRETLAVCKSLWAQFNVLSMIQGIVVLALALVVLAVFAAGVNGDVTELVPRLLVRGVGGSLAGGLLATILARISPNFPFIQTIVLLSALASIAGMASVFWLASDRVRLPLPRSAWAAVAVLFTALLSIGFASNSYTIWEDDILLFFLTSFGVMLFVSSLRQQDVANRAIGCLHSLQFIVLGRLASLSRLCRDEQMQYCESTYYRSTGSSTSATWQLFIPFVVSFILPAVIKGYYRNTRSYNGSAVVWLGLAFPVGLSVSAAYWILDAADNDRWFQANGFLPSLKLFLAQVVLAVALAAGYSTFAWAAPFVAIEARATQQNGAAQTGFVSQDGKSHVAVLGYGNAHGSRYAMLLTMWALAVGLLQKPMGAGAVAAQTWQVFSLLEALAANGLQQSAAGPTVLALLGSFHYFKTGHQATLSSIQWESAFIPLASIRYPWTPLLVVLNTFGAQVLAAVAVPLVALWRVPPRRRGLLGDVARAYAVHVLFYATVSLATAAWAGHLRRHLMLYRIFNPRFMMGAAALAVVEVFGVLVAVGGVRWSMGSVADAFGYPS